MRAKWIVCFIASSLLLPGNVEAKKRTEVLLYSFTGGTDGASPVGALVADTAGNLYGATGSGGPYSKGVVYKLAPNGVMTLIYAFFGEEDGGYPTSGVVLDSSGNLYGTTAQGGINNAGVFFKITPDGREIAFHKFGKPGDGQLPLGDLITDSFGNFFGVTEGGGAYLWGAVYKISPTGKEKILYSFTGGSDGGAPAAGLLRDNSGYLYGTFPKGIFKLSGTGNESVLHDFIDDEGSSPLGQLIFDRKGNLVGTNQYSGQYDRGTIFAIAVDGSEAAIHGFDGPDGTKPRAGLVADSKGNLYGVACTGGKVDGGTAYKLNSDFSVHVVHNFGTKGRGPDCPSAKLLVDAADNLFGTTVYGGAYDSGTIFEIKK